MVFLWCIYVLLIFAAVIAVIGICIDYFCEYRGQIMRHGSLIKLKSFLIFYEINPDRWILHGWRVTCKVPSEHPRLYSYDEVDFHFSYIDTCKYRLWYKNREKQLEKKNLDKNTIRMLQAVKTDIAKLNNKAQKEINEAEELLKGIKL